MTSLDLPSATYLFIQFLRFSQQVYWGGLPFSSPEDHVLSELSSMTPPSWVALHGMAHSFIELHKPFCHDKAAIHEGRFNALATCCEWQTHWDRPSCWERLKAEGEEGDRV